MNESEPRYKSLRDYLAVLRHQWVAIIGIALVAAAIALGVSLRADKVYEATAAVSFQDQSQQLSLLGGSISPKTPPDQTPQARAETINQPAVARRAQRALRTELSTAELQAAVQTSVDPDSFLVSVTASWGNARFATRLANAFAKAATRYTNQQASREFDAALRSVTERLSDLGVSTTPIDLAQRSALVEQLSRLQFLTKNPDAAKLARTAQQPAVPASPHPVRNTALGALLGLVLGVMVAFLRDSLDRRLHGPHQIRQELGIPVVGHIRDDALGRIIRPGPGVDIDSEDLEAARILRQNLAFLSVDDPLRIVLVTSPLPEEGKSTAASSLACASAAAGIRTLLVDCDLRRPSLAERLHVDQAPGLTDYLAGQASPAEVLRTLPPADDEAPPDVNGSGESRSESAGAAALVYVTAGTTSPQPDELLHSARFQRFLEKVAKVYDRVILDTSPLLPVADTLEMLPHVSGVLLCVRSGQTTREQGLAATEALERFPPRPTGVVVTGLTRRDADGYGYYSYDYSYRAAQSRQSSLT